MMRPRQVINALASPVVLNTPLCACHPPRFTDVRVSTTVTNPRRAYFCCPACGYFRWISPADVIFKGNVNLISGEQSQPTNPQPNNNVGAGYMKWAAIIIVLLLLVVIKG